jgi:hypothetical protein
MNNPKSKKNPKLKRNQGLLIKQATKNKILRLYSYDKSQETKLVKLVKKTFDPSISIKSRLKSCKPIIQLCQKFFPGNKDKSGKRKEI